MWILFAIIWYYFYGKSFNVVDTIEHLTSVRYSFSYMKQKKDIKIIFFLLKLIQIFYFYSSFCFDRKIDKKINKLNILVKSNILARLIMIRNRNWFHEEISITPNYQITFVTFHCCIKNSKWNEMLICVQPNGNRNLVKWNTPKIKRNIKINF